MQPPPFFPNTPDNTHCYQAVFKMLLKQYFPNEECSWDELEKITAKVEGLWTWPTAGLLWLAEKGLAVKSVGLFDYEAFVEQGEGYLLDFYGENIGQSQIDHSDIPQEQIIAQEYVAKAIRETRLAQIADITTALDSDSFVICNVNLKALNNEAGYSGHFVLIYGHDDKNLFLQDPGLPAQKEHKVSFDQFIKAWAYPSEKSQGMAVISFVPTFAASEKTEEAYRAAKADEKAGKLISVDNLEEFLADL
ncbi:MAG: hypothetical protein GW947_01980 [Candidatus Pacebacteria bacterium]|nr:hypothetical protein [Candidatus Paceibacterota bacterium]PIR60984.1 MAG: hypothetical protein COU68_01850 [Candidatus Pacebacteria bacterium CG10_big_fil_rev_8_21_14_0_10_45_6]